MNYRLLFVISFVCFAVSVACSGAVHTGLTASSRDQRGTDLQPFVFAPSTQNSTNSAVLDPSTPYDSSGDETARQTTLPDHVIDDLRLPSVHRQQIGKFGTDFQHVNVPSLPVVHVRIRVGVGWGMDGEQRGIAMMTALSMLPELQVINGTKLTDAGERVIHLEPPRVWIGREATVFSLNVSLASSTPNTVTTVAEKRHDALVKALRNMLQNPSFSPGFVAEGRRDSVRQMQWQHNEMLSQRALLSAQGANWDGPGCSDCDKIQDWHCRAFHKGFYDPRDLKWVWVGDIDVADAQSITERVMMGWKIPTPPKQPTQLVQPATTTLHGTLETASRTAFETTGTDTSANTFRAGMQVRMLAAGPQPLDADWPALWVVAQALDTECNAIGWAEPVFSFRVCVSSAAPSKGVLLESSQQKMQQALLEKLQHIATHGLTKQQLQQAKFDLVQREARRLGQASYLADTLSRWDLSFVNNVGKRVRQVQDVRGAIARHLHRNAVHFVVLQHDGANQ